MCAIVALFSILAYSGTMCGVWRIPVHVCVVMALFDGVAYSRAYVWCHGVLKCIQGLMACFMYSKHRVQVHMCDVWRIWLHVWCNGVV